MVSEGFITAADAIMHVQHSDRPALRSVLNASQAVLAAVLSNLEPC